MNVLTIHANGKINLSLDVLRRLENGYHEVEMIMQTVGIHDTLTLRKQDDDKIMISADNTTIPCDEHNLIYKAILRLQEETGKTFGVAIDLKKRIPIAAGMAGGSTDAAATLLGVNELFDLGLSMETLEKIAVKIGADVPYCLHGGTYLSQGIGEVLTPIEAPPQCYLVIAKPDISVSTKFVYEHLRLDEKTKHPDTPGMIEAIKEKDVEKMASKLCNVLESVTENEYPIIQRIKESLLTDHALGALMSGSGPTVFGIFTDKEQATKALHTLEENQLISQGFVTTFTEGTGTVEGRSENG